MSKARGQGRAGVTKGRADEQARTETKLCASCGRLIEWRAKWRNNWLEVRYCSQACRGGSKRAGVALEAAVLAAAATVAAPKTICPSQVTLAYFGNKSQWPATAMEEVRRAARRLVHGGLVEVLQNNQVVDAATVRGPIRLRLTAAGWALAAAGPSEPSP